MGRKWEIPEKKHLTTHKQNLACLTWPELGLNPQRWDDERFRVLMISRFNHSAMGAVPTKIAVIILKDKQMQRELQTE